MNQYKVSSEHFHIATQILDDFVLFNGSETSYLESEGDILSLEETKQIVMTYLEQLDIVDQIIINFTPNQVAPTSVCNDHKTGKTRLNIKTPVEYRRGRIMGTLDHEIGTHYLRKHNEKY